MAISRKNLTLALIATADLEKVEAYLDAGSIDVQTAIDKTVAALNRPHKSKPSAETMRNRAIMLELVDELNARGVEMTAAALADVYTDPEGCVLNPRKVGAALARAAREGLIAKSPEKWSVAHYAPHGVEFTPKPKRIRKAKAEDTDAPEDVTN